MNYDLLIVRYGEIGTKGQNRGFFEKRLADNVKDCLEKNKTPYSKIIWPKGRLLIEGVDAPKAAKTLRRVFGIVSTSPALVTGTDLESLNKAADSLAENAKLGPKKTFKIEARRNDKTTPLNSIQMNHLVGEHVLEKFKCRVDVHEPDLTIYIETLQGKALLFTEKVPGFGGLPLGIEGAVECTAATKGDALACWMLMKRGCWPALKGKGAYKKVIDAFSYGKPVESRPLATVSGKAPAKKKGKQVTFHPLVGLGKKEKEALWKAAMEALK